jgi:hypothetical protein
LPRPLRVQEELQGQPRGAVNDPIPTIGLAAAQFMLVQPKKMSDFTSKTLQN